MSEPRTPTPTTHDDDDEPKTPPDISYKSGLRSRSENAKRLKNKPPSEITAALETLAIANDEIGAVEDVTLDIYQVTDMSCHDVLTRILEILKTSVLGHENYTFSLPSRGKPWQAYSNRLSRTVLLKSRILDSGKVKKNLLLRDTKDKATKHQAICLYEVLCIMKELLESKSQVSKRSLYYSNRRLFNDQGRCDSLIEDVACYVGCKRDNLPIYAESTGKIGGLLSYTYGEEVFDCRRGHGYAIPRSIDEFEINNNGAKCIMVVEKHSVFGRLMDAKFFETIPCVLLSGGGMPAIATRKMLRKLALEFKLPVVALTDCGSYGLLIFMVYLVGSGSMAYDSEDLCTPNIRWLGVKPSDIPTYEIPKDHVHKFSSSDDSILDEPIWIDRVMSDNDLLKEYEIMDQRREKFEIEDLNFHGFSYLIDVYLMDQFARLTDSSPVMEMTRGVQKLGIEGVKLL